MTSIADSRLRQHHDDQRTFDYSAPVGLLVAILSLTVIDCPKLRLFLALDVRFIQKSTPRVL